MEAEFLRWLQQRVAISARSPLGLTDDAALLPWRDPQACVLTTDMLMDGVDFELSQIGARRAGYKALAVNLSDLAAMAARPIGALISLALPRSEAATLGPALFEGLLPLAADYGVAILGGDTNSWNGPFVISVTAVGEVSEQGALLRSGGRVGDTLVATGQFGGSLLGRHLDFRPRVEEALLLRSRYELHAGMDVSDGLSLDTSRLAAASGCGALLRLDWIPLAPTAFEIAATDGTSALEHALADGEDFELIMALPPSEAERLVADQPLDIPLTVIGSLVTQPGLWQQTDRETPRPLVPRGYEH